MKVWNKYVKVLSYSIIQVLLQMKASFLHALNLRGEYEATKTGLTHPQTFSHRKILFLKAFSKIKNIYYEKH